MQNGSTDEGLNLLSFVCFSFISSSPENPSLLASQNSSFSISGYNSDISSRPGAGKKFGLSHKEDKDADPLNNNLATAGHTCWVLTSTWLTVSHVGLQLPHHPPGSPEQSRGQTLVAQVPVLPWMVVPSSICWALPVCQTLCLWPIPLPSVIPHDIACPDWKVLLTKNCPNYSPRAYGFNFITKLPLSRSTWSPRAAPHPASPSFSSMLDWWTTLYRNLNAINTNYEADGVGGRKCAKMAK